MSRPLLRRTGNARQLPSSSDRASDHDGVASAEWRTRRAHCEILFACSGLLPDMNSEENLDIANDTIRPPSAPARRSFHGDERPIGRGRATPSFFEFGQTEACANMALIGSCSTGSKHGKAMCICSPVLPTTGEAALIGLSRTTRHACVHPYSRAVEPAGTGSKASRAWS
jgi:hypothetical protein